MLNQIREKAFDDRIDFFVQEIIVIDVHFSNTRNRKNRTKLQGEFENME